MDLRTPLTTLHDALDEETDTVLDEIRRTRASAMWPEICVGDCSGFTRDLVDDLQWMDERLTAYANGVQLLVAQDRERVVADLEKFRKITDDLNRRVTNLERIYKRPVPTSV